MRTGHDRSFPGIKVEVGGQGHTSKVRVIGRNVVGGISILNRRQFSSATHDIGQL